MSVKFTPEQQQENAVNEALDFIVSHYNIPADNRKVLRSYLNIVYTQACIDQIRNDVTATDRIFGGKK